MRVVELGQADSGGSRTVALGEDVAIALHENPTTGYRWQVTIDDSFLRVVADDFKGSSELRGAGGIRVLTFTTLQHGQVRLTLDRRRDWESVAVEEFWVDLTIT